MEVRRDFGALRQTGLSAFGSKRKALQTTGYQSFWSIFPFTIRFFDVFGGFLTHSHLQRLPIEASFCHDSLQDLPPALSVQIDAVDESLQRPIPSIVHPVIPMAGTTIFFHPFVYFGIELKAVTSIDRHRASIDVS